MSVCVCVCVMCMYMCWQAAAGTAKEKFTIFSVAAYFSVLNIPQLLNHLEDLEALATRYINYEMEQRKKNVWRFSPFSYSSMCNQNSVIAKVNNLESLEPNTDTLINVFHCVYRCIQKTFAPQLLTKVYKFTPINIVQGLISFTNNCETE